MTLHDKSTSAPHIYAPPIDPELEALLEKARRYKMTPAEIQAQRESWARGMSPCEHGVSDFETCSKCREPSSPQEEIAAGAGALLWCIAAAVVCAVTVLAVWVTG